jgi:hypothetical protein
VKFSQHAQRTLVTTVNFTNGQTEFAQNIKKVLARQKTLRRAADFGFILSCRFNRQPARQLPAANA